MKRYRNWLTGAMVTVVKEHDGFIEYVKDVKQTNEYGQAVESHTKPRDVFEKIFSKR